MSIDKALAPFWVDSRRRVIASVVACENLICDLFDATVAKSRNQIDKLFLLLLGELFIGRLASAPRIDASTSAPKANVGDAEFVRYLSNIRLRMQDRYNNGSGDLLFFVFVLPRRHFDVLFAMRGLFLRCPLIRVCVFLESAC